MKDLMKDPKHFSEEKLICLLQLLLKAMEEAVPEPSTLSYDGLSRIRLKAYRNGNWRKLGGIEKALFKASLELARLRGRIVNPSLIKSLKDIISRLIQTPASKILQFGRDYASRLSELYRSKGVLEWAPNVKSWLKDPSYVFWLGTKQLALESVGYA